MKAEEIRRNNWWWKILEQWDGVVGLGKVREWRVEEGDPGLGEQEILVWRGMLVSFSHIHMCAECTEYLLFVECGERLFWSSTPELFTALCTMERNELRGIWSSKVLTTPYPVTLLLATRWSNSSNLLWISLGGLRVGCVCVGGLVSTCWLDWDWTFIFLFLSIWFHSLLC